MLTLFIHLANVKICGEDAELRNEILVSFALLDITVLFFIDRLFF